MATINKYVNSDSLNLQESIRGRVHNYLFIGKNTELHESCTKTDSCLNFVDTTIVQDIVNNITPAYKPTVNGTKLAIIDDLYTTNSTPTKSNIDLERKNILRTNYGDFEFRLGVITSQKRLEVTLVSTYTTDLTIDNVTSDSNLGIYTEFPNGTTIHTNSGLQFLFKIVVDKGDKYIENMLYFHLSNGVIIPWKFCFIRALKNLYFLSPDKHSYKERYYFSSKNFLSLGGREDVIPFMDTPKQGFSATYSYRKYNEMEAMRNVALMNEYKSAYFPIWSEIASVTQAQTSASYLVYVSKISSFAKTGVKLALINKLDFTIFKIVVVSSVSTTDNIITLTDAVTYTQDYLVVPIVPVVLESNPSTQYYNVKDQKLSISVRTLE